MAPTSLLVVYEYQNLRKNLQNVNRSRTLGKIFGLPVYMSYSLLPSPFPILASVHCKRELEGVVVTNDVKSKKSLFMTDTYNSFNKNLKICYFLNICCTHLKINKYRRFYFRHHRRQPKNSDRSEFLKTWHVFFQIC